MKLIKSITCLILASVATISASGFEDGLYGESTVVSSGIVDSSAGMTSTADFGLTSREATVLSLAGLFPLVDDAATADAIKGVLEMFGTGNLEGVNVLSTIEFTDTNSSDPAYANLIKASIPALFITADGTPVDVASTTAWRVHENGILADDQSDVEATTVLSISTGQKLLIELARKVPELPSSDGTTIGTLSLLGFDAATAYARLTDGLSIRGVVEGADEKSINQLTTSLLESLSATTIAKQDEKDTDVDDVTAMMSSSFVASSVIPSSTDNDNKTPMLEVVNDTGVDIVASGDISTSRIVNNTGGDIIVPDDISTSEVEA